jgi:hypothetical protein
MPEYEPALTINMADSRLDDAGYTRRWYTHGDAGKHLWRQATKTNVIAWGDVGLVTLEPQRPRTATEAAAAQWTAGGTNASWAETDNGELGPGKALFQRVPTATDCTLVSNFTPAHNQPFFLDLYLYELASSALWYADVQFCLDYKLRLLENGTFELFRDMSIGDDDADWQYVAETRTGEKLFSRHMRMAVYPTNKQVLLIQMDGQEMFRYVDAEPLVIEEDDGNEVRAIARGNPVNIYVAHGAFHIGYRYMTFPTSGDFYLPTQYLPWVYDGEFELEYGSSRPQPDTDALTVVLEIVDEAGTEITSPPADEGEFDSFRPHISITGGDGSSTPEIYWSEMRIAPVTKVYTPAAPSPIVVGSGGRLLSVSVNDDIDGQRTANIDINNIDGTASDYGLTDTLDMFTQIVVSGTTVWRGYLRHMEEPEQQSGNIQLLLSGRDRTARLEVPLSDSYIGDGKNDTDFVEELYKRAGLAAADYVIDTVEPIELPIAIDQEKPIFQARDGRFIKEMVDYICKIWTGREQYALQDGKLYYGPRVTEGDAVRLFIGEEPSSLPDPLPDYYDESAAYIKYYDATHTRDEESFFNRIVVVGLAIDGVPLVAEHYDADSIGDDTSTDYLGYEKLLLIADPNLKTIEQVETALGYVVAFHGAPLHEMDLRCAFDADLDVRDLVAVVDQGTTQNIGDPPEETFVPYLWQVRGVRRDWRYSAQMSVRLRRIGDVEVEE